MYVEKIDDKIDQHKGEIGTNGSHDSTTEDLQNQATVLTWTHHYGREAESKEETDGESEDGDLCHGGVAKMVEGRIVALMRIKDEEKPGKDGSSKCGKDPLQIE